MGKIKEITIFCYGDSRNISCWSNVPFFLTTTLEKKGIIVNRVNILGQNPTLKKIFNHSTYQLINKLDKNNDYDYLRSFLFKTETYQKIKKAVKRFNQSDAFFFINFDFTTKRYSNKPSILFGDWTYEHHIKYFLEKKPNLFELQFIKRQNRNINESDAVFPLFPSMAKNLSRTHNGNIKYLGNVINSLYESDDEEILEIKERSKKILFIGSVHYMEGAKILIEAYKKLKEKYPEISLDFIGLKASDFQKIPKDVTCHGYLYKEDNEHRNTYYKLLKEAKVFVNTTPKWSAFSASIEAMYFCTPVIVPPYEEFYETFGKEFSGGIYCDNNDELSEKIELIFTMKTYRKTCVDAKKAVKEFTWDSYVDKMIEEIKKLS